jgi:uncharacterized delta-60 repeat protein
MIEGPSRGRAAKLLLGLFAALALVVPTAANAAFVEGKAFIKGGGLPSQVLRYGKTGTLLVTNDGVTRLNGNGTVARSFGNRGSVAIPKATAAAVLSNGKILVLSEELSITRLLSDGKRDSSFGRAGQVVLSFGPASFFDQMATAMAVMPNGRIAIAGRTQEDAGGRAGILGTDVFVRLLPNGALDNSFGDGGRFTPGTTDANGIFFPVRQKIESLQVAPGNELIAQNNEESLLLKVTATGALDPSFGQGGILDRSGRGGYVSSVDGPIVQAGGKLLSFGAQLSTGGELALSSSRFNADGSLDTSYGTGGRSLYGGGGVRFFEGAGAVATGGVVLVATTTTVTTPPEVGGRLGALAIAPNGELDRKFGSNGGVTINYPGSIRAVGVVLQPEERALIVGYQNNVNLEAGVLLARVPLTRKR